MYTKTAVALALVGYASAFTAPTPLALRKPVRSQVLLSQRHSPRGNARASMDPRIMTCFGLGAEVTLGLSAGRWHVHVRYLERREGRRGRCRAHLGRPRLRG